MDRPGNRARADRSHADGAAMDRSAQRADARLTAAVFNRSEDLLRQFLRQQLRSERRGRHVSRVCALAIRRAPGGIHGIRPDGPDARRLVTGDRGACGPAVRAGDRVGSRADRRARHGVSRLRDGRRRRLQRARRSGRRGACVERPLEPAAPRDRIADRCRPPLRAPSSRDDTRARHVRARPGHSGRSGVVPGTGPRDRSSARDVPRARAGDRAGHAAADHGERARDDAVGVRGALRPERGRASAGDRVIDIVSRSRRDRQSAGGPALRVRRASARENPQHLMKRFVWSIASVLAAALVLVIVLASGIGGLLYGVLYAVTLVPGLPVGFALFGRRHGAGWIAGAALGYFITTLALWLAIALGLPSILTFIAGWMLALALTWVSTRGVVTPLVPLPAWTERDTAAWLTVLLLVPGIAGPPFIRLGARDANGNRYYRAYFTADFVWHMAVTSELKKFAMPPRNMYMPHRPLHYYWAYYIAPAAIAGTGPGQLANVEADLKVNAIGTALLLVSTLFLAAWTAVPHAFAAAAGVTLATVASSAEGTVALLRLVERGAPLGAVRDLNIDAISNWWFGGLRIDGIPRCFWWVPQHSMSYILGLVALAV